MKYLSLFIFLLFTASVSAQAVRIGGYTIHGVSNDPTLGDSSTIEIPTEAAVKAALNGKGQLDSIVLLPGNILIVYDPAGSEVFRDTIDATSDPALGGDLTGTASNAQIAAGAVTTAEILNSTILQEDLAFTPLVPGDTSSLLATQYDLSLLPDSSLLSTDYERDTAAANIRAEIAAHPGDGNGIFSPGGGDIPKGNYAIVGDSVDAFNIYWPTGGIPALSFDFTFGFVNTNKIELQSPAGAYLALRDSSSSTAKTVLLKGGLNELQVNSVYGTLLKGGAKYLADYSASYTPRSLVDKAYVDGAVTAGGSGFVAYADSNDVFVTPAQLAAAGGDGNGIYSNDGDINTERFVGLTQSGGILNIFDVDSGNPLLALDPYSYAVNMQSADFSSTAFSMSFSQATQKAFLTDNRAVKKGLEYNADYSSGLKANARSIPDVGTVSQMISDSLAGFSGGGGAPTLQDVIDEQVSSFYIYYEMPSIYVEDDGATHEMSVDGGEELRLQSATGNVSFGETEIRLTDYKGTKTGLTYAADYSSGLKANLRSVPDVGTVAQIISDSLAGIGAPTLQDVIDEQVGAGSTLIVDFPSIGIDDVGGNAEIKSNEDASLTVGSARSWLFFNDAFLQVYDDKTTPTGMEYADDYSAQLKASERAIPDVGTVSQMISDSLAGIAGDVPTWQDVIDEQVSGGFISAALPGFNLTSDSETIEFNLTGTGDKFWFLAPNALLEISGADITVRDFKATKRGLVYGGNYSSDIKTNARSIPDVGTVAAIISDSLAGFGGGDNLGNHTATQDLDLAGYSLNNVDSLNFKDASGDRGTILPGALNADRTYTLINRSGEIALRTLEVETYNTSATHIIKATDDYIRVDGSAGAQTYTLPTATEGRVLIFKRIDNNPATTITFTGTVDGAANPVSTTGGSPIEVLATQYGFMTIVGNGSAWEKIN